MASSTHWRRSPSIVVGTILFKVLAPKGSLWVGNGVQNIAGDWRCCRSPSRFPASATLCRVRGCWARSPPGAGGSILAYLLWFHLLKVCGATAASAYHFLMPPLGMLFAFLVLGEHVEFRDLLGIIPVALGIYLVTRPAAVVGPLRKGVRHDLIHHPDRRADRAD